MWAVKSHTTEVFDTLFIRYNFHIAYRAAETLATEYVG